MIQRATGPQCLSSRVSALADGSLPDDVRDRALAHVTSCPDCRADLEAELLLRARLRALPAPRPSSSLVSSLLAMGEPGGPVPPRVGHVPGTPRPAPVTIRREPATGVPWQRASSLRPPSLHASSRRRAVVGATAGAVGAGVIAAALASGLPAAPQVTAAQVHEQASAVDVSTRLPPGGSDLYPASRAGFDQTTGNAGTGTRLLGGVTGVEAVFSTSGGTTAGVSRGSTAQTIVPVTVTTTLLHHLLAAPAYRAVNPMPGRRALTQPPAGLAR